MTSDTTDLAYSTPSTSANANLTTDMTSAIAIGSGVAVWFGATSPTAASKAASTTANPAYTSYLTTQLQTTGSAAAGDTATVTLTLRYDENSWIAVLAPFALAAGAILNSVGGLI